MFLSPLLMMGFMSLVPLILWGPCLRIIVTAPSKVWRSGPKTSTAQTLRLRYRKISTLSGRRE